MLFLFGSNKISITFVAVINKFECELYIIYGLIKVWVMNLNKLMKVSDGKMPSKYQQKITDSIGKWHNFTENDQKLAESSPKGVYYVIARDKFMSGWGGAESKTSYMVIVCWSSLQAEYAEESVMQAKEMRNVRIAYDIPKRLNGDVSFYNFDKSPRFNQEYKWRLSQTKEQDQIVPHESDMTKQV